MKICPKCNLNHSKLGIFCSRKCANSRKHNNKTKKKISIGVRASPVKRGPMTEQEILNRSASVKATRLKKYLETPFDDLGPENRRRRVFEEQLHKCNRCGIDSWLGEKLSLELEHKDGNNKNNARENLESLCPNCHSLTSTWRGRNKK